MSGGDQFSVDVFSHDYGTLTVFSLIGQNSTTAASADLASVPSATIPLILVRDIRFGNNFPGSVYRVGSHLRRVGRGSGSAPINNSSMRDQIRLVKYNLR
jgi:hypothetical protein